MIMRKVLLFLFVSTLFVACSSDDDPVNPEDDIIKDLKLSVEGYIETEDIEFEFEILEGNGGYTADVNEEDAKVTIEGTKVKVELLSFNAGITISDKKEQSQSIVIRSLAESLVPHGYGISMDVGTSSVMSEIKFGAGGYSLKKIKGTSAEATLDENGLVNVTSIKPGNTYYKIIDKRGTTADLTIWVFEVYDLTTNSLDINAINDQSISVRLKWGEGNWQLVKDPASPLIEKLSIMEKGNITKEYDILQIDTSKDNVRGTALIQLKDKAGNLATIKLNIE